MQQEFYLRRFVNKALQVEAGGKKARVLRLGKHPLLARVGEERLGQVDGHSI